MIMVRFSKKKSFSLYFQENKSIGGADLFHVNRQTDRQTEKNNKKSRHGRGYNRFS